jgi:integrase
MAYVEERLSGWLVVWKDCETGKRRSKLVRWGYTRTNFVTNQDELVTKDIGRGEADDLAAEMRQYEPRAQRRGEARIRERDERLRRMGYDPGFDAFYTEIGKEPENQLARYLTAMIEANRELKDSTRELYLRNIRVHIADSTLGQTDIRDIAEHPEALTGYWRTLQVGTGARRNIHQLLSKAFNRAVVTGLIPANPLKRAPEVKRPPRGRREEVNPLTIAQVEKLADSATCRRDRLEMLIMSFGGLRAGEVGGLRVADVDLKRCQFKLRQQVVRVTGRGQYVSPLKTRAAKRTVTLPCSITDELKAFIADEPPAADGRVFHGADGKMRAHNAINHSVQMAAKRAGFPAFAHQLRHTAVSLLIDAGANPKAIQAFVGHSDIRETLQTYGHLFDNGGQALADILEKLREEHRNGDDGRRADRTDAHARRVPDATLALKPRSTRPEPPSRGRADRRSAEAVASPENARALVPSR